MNDWLHFSDARFALEFQYPQVTPQGNTVQWAEREGPESVRVHLTSTGSREAYFEIIRYSNLSAPMEHERHTQTLEQRNEGFVLTDLKEIRWLSRPAYEYSIRWSGGTRIVRLIEDETGTYRILYDPASPLNSQILSTVRWKQ